MGRGLIGLRDSFGVVLSCLLLCSCSGGTPYYTSLLPDPLESLLQVNSHSENLVEYYKQNGIKHKFDPSSGELKAMVYDLGGRILTTEALIVVAKVREGKISDFSVGLTHIGPLRNGELLGLSLSQAPLYFTRLIVLCLSSFTPDTSGFVSINFDMESW